MTSLLLCDDHPLIVGGLRALIGGHPNYEIVGTTCSGEEAQRLLARQPPDMALLDILMPEITGIDLLKWINRERLPVKVVLLTASISDAEIIDVIAANVAGILLKESAFETLIHCLDTVARGRRWLPPDLVQPAIARSRSVSRDISPYDQLTRREADVARHIVEGRSNRDIAAALGISEGTVKIHLHAIYSKLGVDNRTAVAIMLMRREPRRAMIERIAL